MSDEHVRAVGFSEYRDRRAHEHADERLHGLMDARTLTDHSDENADRNPENSTEREPRHLNSGYPFSRTEASCTRANRRLGQPGDSSKAHLYIDPKSLPESR